MKRKKTERVEFYLFIIFILLIFYPLFLFPKDSKVPDKNPQIQLNKIENPENRNQTVDKNNPPEYQYKAPVFETGKISYPMLILRTIAVLAIIIISIFVIFKILVKKKGKIFSDSEVIKVLARFPLEANKLIQIVDIAGKVLVLGVTDSSINLITTIEDRDVIDSIKLYYSKGKAEKTGFKEQFLKLLSGKVFSKAGQISYLDNYRKRIKKMKKL